MVTYKKIGSAFEEAVEAIVNPVNCVGVMGAGFAEECQRRYPKCFQPYRAACLTGKLTPGTVLVFSTGLEQPKYIIQFPTKTDWRYSSRIEYITEGMKALVNAIKGLNIKSIVMPALGCGHGDLDWNLVKKEIEIAIEELSDVEIVVFEPQNDKKQHKNGKKQRKMR